MKKIMILLAEGFEEGESLFVVDILRRAGFICDIVSIKDKYVKSSHGIKVEADLLISEIDKDSYDMVILPGGQPGADNLMNSNEVCNLVKEFNSKNKYIAAICAAPQVLAKCEIVNNKKVTSYPSYKDLFKNSIYVEDIVVKDGNIITSRGPATTLLFAYTLVDVLGGDSNSLKQGMLYNDFCEYIKR